jgi:putative oxidoreductase
MTINQPASPRQIDAALGVLRAVTGIIFAAHGTQKLFVYGIDGVVAGFTQMGIPGAAVAGPMVAILEFVGGIALFLGLLTRPFAAGLAAVMLGAIVFTHWSAGFFMPNGYEFVLALLTAAVTFSITGAGRYSLDALLRRSSIPASN